MKKIIIAAGDGIGPEICSGAVQAIDKVSKIYKYQIEFEDILIGGQAIDAYGVPLREEDIKKAKESDGVLLGAVGGPKWDKIDPTLRPEQGLLKLRKDLEVYANLRPAIIYKDLKAASPIKDQILGDGIDILVVRELVGGIYFGKRDTYTNDQGLRVAYDQEQYTEAEIRRIALIAFEAAMTRSKKLCSVDKANVLDSSKLWRTVVEEVAQDYPQVELKHLYVDAAAMEVVRNPRQFDVILTNNIFGDILSDQISQITGSIGMLPSASLGQGKAGIYEPIHGSAPDIAGQDKANPIAMILSAAMLLRHGLGLEDQAQAIEKAVNLALEQGYRTVDIARPGDKIVGTKEMTKLIVDLIQ